jgi:hypothetical protein
VPNPKQKHITAVQQLLQIKKLLARIDIILLLHPCIISRKLQVALLAVNDNVNDKHRKLC